MARLVKACVLELMLILTGDDRHLVLTMYAFWILDVIEHHCVSCHGYIRFLHSLSTGRSSTTTPMHRESFCNLLAWASQRNLRDVASTKSDVHRCVPSRSAIFLSCSLSAVQLRIFRLGSGCFAALLLRIPYRGA
ncbi:hypothetical protein K438DRAFT_702951 [Mycena galopus ATCC 62051]|nr:hypothetical protein K438DRAFT_702951 [Mycena galopus ATCC 62051]